MHILAGAVLDNPGGIGTLPQHAADRLLAAGWPKPRTVNSAADLDALPHESVILDSLGDVYEKWSPPDESMTEWMTPGTSWTPAPTLPATVLFTPGDAG